MPVSYIGGELMKNYYNIILSLTILSLMSVGWGQIDTENYSQEIINISDEEVMIISNHEIGGYTYSDTIYISVSRLLPPCDAGYTEIDSSCYYQSDLDVLQIFIDNSIETINMEMDTNENGIIEPLELGDQYWGNGRITVLRARDSYEYPQLSGEIPQNIGDLQHLTNLALWGNELSGEIPESIGNLTNLNYLGLSDNQLSGEIPESIGNLTSIGSYLLLGWNQLSGEIPESIGNLTQVLNFNLRFNQISGALPENIGNMTNLMGLYLDYNELDEIPESIGNLTNLETLYLSNNQITALPQSICDLNLDWNEGFRFNCGNNYICDAIPECILYSEGINFGFDNDTGEYGYQPQNCEPEDVYGCTDLVACNYNPDATEDDGSCEYEVDECGICGGDSSSCSDCAGDLNGDGGWNVLDVVTLANCVLANNCGDLEYGCDGDINGDGLVNVLDIVMLVDIILGI